MAVTHLEITRREPFAGGRAFGDVGVYERVDGRLHFAADPANPANAAIVDLGNAPKDAEGRVRWWADFCLLRPADPARGSRRLLLEVLNRGRKLVPGLFLYSPAAPAPSAEVDPGDGFLFERGWTVAWVGWQWDVNRSDALMGLEAPQALGPDGAPIPGQVMVRFQPVARSADRLLADRVHQPYPAADLDQPDARLLVREWGDGDAVEIPRDRWRFARDEGGRAVPADTHVRLEGGFEPGRVYEVVYRTRISPVVGTGLLAIRDTGAWLKGDNGLTGQIDRAHVFGMSQSGRFLRHFLYLGLNLDENGRQVFDGVIPHVAGARRGEFNHRYGQPSVQNTPGFGHRFPYHDDEQTDPHSGETGALLRRQRELGGLPKIVAINTTAEYFRGDASLTHTDAAGTRDADPPAGVRNYFFASTQHGPGHVPLVRVNPNDGSVGAHGFNSLDYSPLMRAALENLDRWVADGVEPPPSVFPRLANGTAVPAREVIGAYRGIPGLTVPSPDRMPVIRRFDLGPDAANGIGRYPAGYGAVYPAYVSSVDADGNEVGGIRLPDLTRPLATLTGWNPRDPETGGPGQIVSMQGSTIPFPRTAEERAATGDPRQSIAERYRDRDDYLAGVRADAERLAADRYLLPEDVDRLVRLAAERWDTFAKG